MSRHLEQDANPNRARARNEVLPAVTAILATVALSGIRQTVSAPVCSASPFDLNWMARLPEASAAQPPRFALRVCEKCVDASYVGV